MKNRLELHPTPHSGIHPDSHPRRRTVLHYLIAALTALPTLPALLGGGLMKELTVPSAAQAAAPHRVCIAYFSHSGNTRTVAQHIHALLGGDMVDIHTVTPYPEEHRVTTEQAKKELAQGYKPPLTTKVPNMQEYDVIFVGSPNWWGTIAPPVMTFLSDYDFTGKTLVPFITHEGSALGRSVADMQKLCPTATILDGLAIRGRAVGGAQKDVDAWLRRVGLLAA